MGLKALKLDKYGRAVRSDGQFELVEGTDAIRQNLKNSLLLYRDEWHLNLTAGIDWIGRLQKPFARRKLKNDIRRILENKTFVDQVILVDLIPDYKQRNLTIEFTILIDNEEINETVEVS